MKKLVVILLLFCGINCSSQTIHNCDSLVLINEDLVTGDTNIGTKDYLYVLNIDGKKGFRIDMNIFIGMLELEIKVFGAGHCVDDDNTAYFLFRDTTRVKIQNKTSFNCDQIFVFYFGGYSGLKLNDLFETFCTKEVLILRVETREGIIEEEFTHEQSKMFMEMMTCLSSYIEFQTNY